MAEGFRFPLKLWQETPDYIQKKKEAEARFKELDKKTRELEISGHFTDVEFTVNCVPVVLHSTQPPLGERPVTADHALELAQVYGTIGHYTVEEIEEYLEGKGPVVGLAMEELGFRRHKTDDSKWARMSTEERRVHEHGELSPMRKDHNYKLYGSTFTTPEKHERERLMDLRTGANAKTQHGETYSLKVGNTGMAYMSMDTNPFWYNPSTLRQFVEQNAQRGHINPEQDGFDLEAKNVRLNSRRNGPDGVHLLGTKDGSTVMEAVWPISVLGGELFEMAADFRDQARVQLIPAVR